MRALLASMVVASAVAAASGARGADAPAGHVAEWIGKDAPELRLSSTEGKSVRLSDYRGKLVVLHFGASW